MRERKTCARGRCGVRDGERRGAEAGAFVPLQIGGSREGKVFGVYAGSRQRKRPLQRRLLPKSASEISTDPDSKLALANAADFCVSICFYSISTYLCLLKNACGQGGSRKIASVPFTLNLEQATDTNRRKNTTPVRLTLRAHRQDPHENWCTCLRCTFDNTVKTLASQEKCERDKWDGTLFPNSRCNRIRREESPQDQG